ncbi:MAG TPA: tripartite tricarboxylate transporter TctB family protein [Candidatus Sulfotelmatobacter sp.]|nr:tripartite tricarboxylate transporter TctB family protein [Candidatus Sulfotelmatobacter sp.]
MRTLKSADLSTGSLLACLGAATLVASRGIKGMAGESLDPRTLPSLVGWSLLFIGVGIVVSALRYRGEPIQIKWPDAAGRRRILAGFVLLVLYLALMEPLGFPITTAMFVASLSWYLGRYRAWISVVLGLATAVVVHFVFIEFLSLGFPLGPIEWLY